MYNINSFFQVKGNKINELHNIYFLIFLVIYYEDLVKFLEGKTKLINLNDLFKEFTEDFDDEEINLFIKNLMQIKSLNSTKDAFQLILFIFNIKKIEKEISQREELKTFFNDIQDKLGTTTIFETILKIHDSLCWIIYENDSSKLKDKYSKYICEGKSTDEEKLYFDIFDKINDISINNEMKGIKIFLLLSLFSNNKIILIKIDIEHLKKNNITLQQIDKNIKNILSKLPSQYQNLNKYLLIDNNIINFNNSYDKFLNEIKKRNKNENEQNEININDTINININNNEIIDINEVKELLNKEKNNNKLLSEKIKKLENELNLEKDKSILLEKNIINLKQELENEIQKNNNLIQNSEEKKSIKSDWNKFNEISQLDLSIIIPAKNLNVLNKGQRIDKEFKNVSLKSKLDNNVNSNNINNNELIQSIIKKDKEIEELKLKLSRFPFMLEEGENLLSIIIKSKDDTMNTPIICKNTDKFYKIEELLCEKYSKYKDTENIFYLNGNKIKKNKNLTQNKIKNGDIIIFDALEEEE